MAKFVAAVLLLLLFWQLRLGAASASQNFSIDGYLRAMQTRHLGTQFFSHLDDLHMRDIANASGTVQLNKQCQTQLLQVLTGLRSRSVWAMKMLDAWGSLPAGILVGNSRDMGNFDECLSIKETLANKQQLQGMYCFLDLPLGQLVGMSTLPDLEIGACFPASCTSDDINILLRQLLKQTLNVTLSQSLDLLYPGSCKVPGRVPFDALTIFTIVLLSVLAGLVCLATLYDYFLVQDQKKLPAVVKVFSARANTRAIFRIVDSKSNPNVIDCLHGMRCLSLIWVVYGHCYLIALRSPNINMADIQSWIVAPYTMFIQHAAFSVDTFFFLSGLLVVMISLRAMERASGSLNLPLMYLHRYLRLTPVLAVGILTYQKLMPYMSSGPRWFYVRVGNFANCQTSWYLSLLYVQNYATQNICLPHTWYLSVDMQLYIISPIMLIALFKWGRNAVAGIIVFMLLLSSCLFSMMLIEHYSLSYVQADPPDSNARIYNSTQTRAAPWLIGLLFGYYLHLNRRRTYNLSRITVWICWLLTLAMLMCAIFALYPWSHWGPPALPILNEAFYTTFTRIGWPLALCWVVFACKYGYGGMANSILSSPLWQPLSKLSYCIYIFHLYVEIVNGARVRTSTYFSDYDVMLKFWGDFGFTVILSYFMYLVVEAPFSGLEMLMLPKPSSTSVNAPAAAEPDTSDKDNEAANGSIAISKPNL